MCVNATVCGDIILMRPDGVLQQFHIKAEPSGETARYKRLKQHNKTVKGRAACASERARVCVLFMPVMAVQVTVIQTLPFLTLHDLLTGGKLLTDFGKIALYHC